MILEHNTSYAITDMKGKMRKLNEMKHNLSRANNKKLWDNKVIMRWMAMKHSETLKLSMTQNKRSKANENYRWSI